MKHLLKSIMLFLMLCIGQNAWGQLSDEIIGSGTFSGTTIKWTLIQRGGKCRLNISGEGAIPDYSSYTAVPWANITAASGNLDARSVITAISVAEGITSIGRGVFNNTAIISFKIPSTCTSIRASAFRSCINLKEIYIPETVTSIASTAFNYCSSLSLVHYDGRCTSNTALSLSNVATNGKIIEKAGAYTTELSYVNVPEGWDYYTHGVKCHSGAWVAESDTKLFFYSNTSGAGVDYATVGNLDAAYQDNRAYHPWRVNCYKYTSLEINKNIASIGENEFFGYSNSDVSKMGYTNMQTITVESGNQNFVVGDEGALYNKAKTILYLYPATSATTDLEVPSTVTEIGSGAFYGASNLCRITFLGTISKIGEYSFSQASSLNYMYFVTETAPSDYPKPSGFNSSAFIGISNEGLVAANASTDDFILFTKYVRGNGIRNWTFDGNSTSSVRAYISNGTLYVKGYGAYTTQSSSASWYSNRNSITKIVIEEGITDIGSNTFSGCSNVTEVTLNNSGTIGNYAFKSCSALTRVNIGSGVTEFEDASWTGEDPFAGCSSLTVNVTDLKSFCSISNIQYLTAKSRTLMVNGVTHSSTTELVIPEGVTYIPNSTFRYFTNVAKIKIPSTLKVIPQNNFSGHIYLTEITVPSTVSSVGEKAFYGCTSLHTATLNNSKDIGSSAFEGCTSLQTVTLNNSGIIGHSAFKNCSALTQVNIGRVKGFEDAGDYGLYPFDGCSKLAIVNTTALYTFCYSYRYDEPYVASRIYYLTSSSYGTASKKTLMINGVTHPSESVLEIPEGVSSISFDIFRNFTNVTKIKIPSSVKVIGKQFANDTYLTEIILPSTFTSIGSDAFDGCTNLGRIVCLAIPCPSADGSIVTNPGNITLKVPHGMGAVYGNANVWKEFNIVECIAATEDVKMFANEKRDFFSPTKTISWKLSDESVATLLNMSNVDMSEGICVQTTDFGYDGTTEQPYKTVNVTAELEDYNTCVWKIKVYPREVTLTDGNAYKNTVDFETEKISYTRTFNATAGKWQCLYVPFDIEVTDDLLENFDFAKLYMVSYHDANNNGEIEDNEPLRMVFSRIYAGKTLHANMPYYIRSKSSGKKTIEVTNTTLKAAANGSVNCSTTEHEYTLVGIYNTTNIKGRYTMASDGTFSYYTKDTNLKANRWYMEVTSRTGSGADLENYARPIEIVVEGDEETTGIADLEDKASDPKNDKIYTLDGRQVTDYDTLPSGIYIVNGKKIYKK